MLDPRIALVEKKFVKDADTIADFRPGDTVKVHVKVKEGNRERIQIFEGVVIGRQHGGIRENFIVRKCGENIPDTLPEHRQSRTRSQGKSSQSKALLSPQTQRKGSSYQRAPRIQLIHRLKIKAADNVCRFCRLFGITEELYFGSCHQQFDSV